MHPPPMPVGLELETCRLGVLSLGWWQKGLSEGVPTVERSV